MTNRILAALTFIMLATVAAKACPAGETIVSGCTNGKCYTYCGRK
jgi:hypothetical protein